MAFCFMDFETQSEADLTIVGGLKYALDTTTRTLLLSWAIDELAVRHRLGATYQLKGTTRA